MEKIMRVHSATLVVSGQWRGTGDSCKAASGFSIPNPEPANSKTCRETHIASPAGRRLRTARSSAFTLVELLVVITIIGILIALLLPAIQAARESARKLQCTNNLKQMALSCLNHEQIQNFLPTGGWGYYWVGDPDRGFDKHQPGGWIYNILPYAEQQTVHDLGAGKSDAEKKTAALTLVHTSLAMANCPSRRLAKPYPNSYLGTTFVAYNAGGVNSVSNSATDNVTARADYAGNVGVATYDVRTGPASASEESTYDWMTTKFNGVIFQRSQTKMADITDGTSNTILLGEKYINSDNYTSGMDWGDNENMYAGFDDDSLRWTFVGYPPQQDHSGDQLPSPFGSAHASGFNVAFCDGSVQSINYSIDILTFSYLGNRKDGKMLDAKKMGF